MITSRRHRDLIRRQRDAHQAELEACRRDLARCGNRIEALQNDLFKCQGLYTEVCGQRDGYARQLAHAERLSDERLLRSEDFEQRLKTMMRRNPQLLESWIRKRNRIHGVHGQGLSL